MASNTYTISRLEVRRVLQALKVSEKSIEGIVSSMEKSHRHINVISFISLLEKAGLERDDIVNVMRRIGMDDVTINTVMGMVDEKKITSEIGRVYNADISFG